MAKRELSSTLRNLKFMQRAAQREEKPKEEVEEKPDEIFFSSSAVRKKCIVIMEGDPHPGAAIGRMSFQNFNPSIDKMNEEATNIPQPEAPGTSSNTKSEQVSFRENGSTLNGGAPSETHYSEGNGELKRKPSEVEAESQNPSKSQRTVQGNQSASPPASSSQKQPKREKLDWNVLRKSKDQPRK